MYRAGRDRKRFNSIGKDGNVCSIFLYSSVDGANRLFLARLGTSGIHLAPWLVQNYGPGAHVLNPLKPGSVSSINDESEYVEVCFLIEHI